MPRIRHKHRWSMRLHLDGCHFYTSSYGCTRCSHALKMYGERDFKEDPYSMIWAEPPPPEEVRRDEKGRFCKPYFKDPEPCERCTALQNGAEPIHHLEIFRP